MPMPSFPDRRAAWRPIPPTTPMPRTECAASAAEAVAEILACADMAVAAIGRQAEARVREINARAEAGPAEEAGARRAHLELLRGELAERAAALALSYGSILEELGAIDRMLGGESAAGAEAGDPDPRVAAIKMTLRERRRVHAPAEQAPVPGAPWVEPPTGADADRESTRELWPGQTGQEWRAAEEPHQSWPPAPEPPVEAPGGGPTSLLAVVAAGRVRSSQAGPSMARAKLLSCDRSDAAR